MSAGALTLVVGVVAAVLVLGIGHLVGSVRQIRRDVGWLHGHLTGGQTTIMEILTEHRARLEAGDRTTQAWRERADREIAENRGRCSTWEIMFRGRSGPMH